MECIILAGGLGTRLQSVVQDVPKCMAPVNGKPFLHYLFDYAEQQGCSRVILSLGHKHEYILEWLKTQRRAFSIDYVIENEPLGTGGGIQLAIKAADEPVVFVLNGDTFFDVPLAELSAFHIQHKAETTLALKFMKDFDRYGIVNTDNAGAINSFEEKQYRAEGNINGGIYCIDVNAFLDKGLPEKFSFEKDYLEIFVRDNRFYGYLCNNYFIDIGIPDDYYRAEEDFKTMFE